MRPTISARRRAPSPAAEDAPQPGDRHGAEHEPDQAGEGTEHGAAECRAQDRAGAFEAALARTEADPAEDGAETNHDCQSHQPRDPPKPARRRRRKTVGSLLLAANNPADRPPSAAE